MPETVEASHRLLLENMINGYAYHKIIFDKDEKPVDYVFLEVNKAFERLTGLKRDEIIGKKVTEVLSGIENDPADWIGVYGMVAITGKPIKFENYARNLKKWYSIYAYSPKKEGYFATIFEDITARKELETCLFTSETKYRRLYETNRDGIVQTNHTGRIVECNKAYADMLGYSKEELLDLTYQQLAPEKWRQIENEIVNQSWEKSGYSPVYEKEFVRKDGSVFPVSVRVLVVNDENGKPLEMWSIVRDITRSKQAEEAITKEKNVLRAIMENTGTMLAYLDPEFNFVAVNSAYAKGSGHTIEEVIGKNHFILFPNEENQAIFEQVRDTGKTLMYNDKPFKFASQPERVTYWNWTLAPVKDETGNVQGLVLSLVETTQRKEIEQELLETLEVSQQRESEISALLKASKAVLYHREFQHITRVIFDTCKELIGASAGYVALLSHAGKENDVLFLDSGTLPCSVDPNLPMPIRGLRGETYRTGKVAYHNDFRHSKWAKLMPEGHVQLKNVLFAPLIIYKKTVGIIGLANKPGGFNKRDANMALAFGEIASIALINSRMLETLEENEKILKAYAEDLEALVEEEANKLKDAERLAAIGETAGMVGHDIRNPLQTITSSVYLAKEEVKSLPASSKKEDLTESLATIEEQVSYINKIISDLQDFVKPLNPKIEETDLHKLVKDSFLSSAIPENIKVLISIEEDLPQLIVDRYLIKRVLINLITNAVQAMPNGGTVTVKATQKDGVVLISVEDTGLGIPEENRNKIFKPLFTTKSKGQGFGLSVCKRLVEAHNGGSITFESEVGKGSKFTIKIPSNVRRPNGWKQVEQS